MNALDFTPTLQAAKLTLQKDGKDTEYYIDVISADAMKVAKAKSDYLSSTVLLSRELEAMTQKDSEMVADKDIKRRSEIMNVELPLVQSRFAVELCGAGNVGDNYKDIVLNNGDVAAAVIALAFSEDRLKKK